MTPLPSTVAAAIGKPCSGMLTKEDFDVNVMLHTTIRH